MDLSPCSWLRNKTMACQWTRSAFYNVAVRSSGERNKTLMHLLTYSGMAYWKRQQLVLFHTVKLSGPVVKRWSMAKGKLREGEHRRDVIFLSELERCAVMVFIKLKMSTPSQGRLLLTSGSRWITHPKLDLWWWLTRPCPGHKLLFRQPYLVWGVKGEQWITLRGANTIKTLAPYQMTGPAEGSALLPEAALTPPSKEICRAHDTHHWFSKTIASAGMINFISSSLYFKDNLCWICPNSNKVNCQKRPED